MSDKEPIDHSSLNDVRDRVAELEVAMRGDLRGNMGVMQNLLALMRTVHEPPDGVVGRVAKLENSQLRHEERAAGAVWAFRLVGAGFFTLLGWALKHYIK